MNKVQLVGRLTKDPEVSVVGQNQTPFARFTVAVDRRFKDANGQRQTDFINCIAWKQTAQFVSNYFKKGQRIGICGSIQTRTYDDPQSGSKKYVTEILAEEVEFVENANQTQTAPQMPPSAPSAPPGYQAQPQYVPNIQAAPVAAPVQQAPSQPQQVQMNLAPQAPAQAPVSAQQLEADYGLPFEL